MLHPVSIIERAFELARAGGCRSTRDVVARLKREGYEECELLQFRGSLSAQIKKLCDAAWKPI
jgi:hypothetical protein